MFEKFNLGGLMKNAQKIQEMFEQSQEQLAKIEVTGESGAGAVTVTMTAKHIVKNVSIDDETKNGDKAILEELVAAAFNAASQKADDASKEHLMSMSQLMGGMNGNDSSDQ